MRESVTAQEVITGIASSMRESLEPLVFSAVAPGLYNVQLRQDSYDRLQSLFPRMAEEAKALLDHELDVLNRSERAGLKSIFKLLQRDKDGSRKVYLKPVDGWHISFSVNNDLPAHRPFYIEVLMASRESDGSGSVAEVAAPDSEAALPEAAEEEGQTEERIQERTVETGRGFGPDQLAATAASGTPVISLGEPKERIIAADIEGVYAEFSFTDDLGPRIYRMKKPQIVIGRGGKEYWVDLKLHTVSDVSHEHLRLRYDEMQGLFFIKDLSTFGTTINGHAMTSSLETRDGVKRDINLWTELPPASRLGLAGVLFLDFRAIKGR